MDKRFEQGRKIANEAVRQLPKDSDFRYFIKWAVLVERLKENRPWKKDTTPFLCTCCGRRSNG